MKPYPALDLIPLDQSFHPPKHILLDPFSPTNPLKIGRQTNARTTPSSSNGFFDSKVLSRTHAEVYFDEGNAWLKDVRSSNGTFVNGERLSAEGQESAPVVLHEGDIIEFGIDILGEDARVLHRKVAARIRVILSASDVPSSSSQPPNSFFPNATTRPIAQSRVAPPAISGFNFSMSSQSHQQSRPSLTLEHVAARLAQELGRAREAAAELAVLQSTMGTISDSLSGNNPLAPASYPPRIPPVRPLPPTIKDTDSEGLQELREQLKDTQQRLEEIEANARHSKEESEEAKVLRVEVDALKNALNERAYETARLAAAISAHVASSSDEGEGSDTGSVSTVVSRTRKRTRRAIPRPSTPEPGRMLENVPPADTSHEELDSLTNRVDELSQSLSNVLENNNRLQDARSHSTSFIDSLHKRLAAIESRPPPSPSLDSERYAHLLRLEEAVSRIESHLPFNKSSSSRKTFSSSRPPSPSSSSSEARPKEEETENDNDNGPALPPTPESAALSLPSLIPDVLKSSSEPEKMIAPISLPGAAAAGVVTVCVLAVAVYWRIAA